MMKTEEKVNWRSGGMAQYGEDVCQNPEQIEKPEQIDSEYHQSIKEPSMRGKATEIARHLRSAHATLSEIEDILFGGGESKDGEAEKNADTPPIDALLARASQLSASLVGRAGTIKSRL